jgi:hypothetical protein
MIIQLSHYTVILQYPPDVGGTYMALVAAQGPHAAITLAKKQAYEACRNFNLVFNLEDFFPAIVLAGWHDNIRPILVVDEKDRPINDDSRLHKAGSTGKYPADSSDDARPTSDDLCGGVQLH